MLKQQTVIILNSVVVELRVGMYCVIMVFPDHTHFLNFDTILKDNNRI